MGQLYSTSISEGVRVGGSTTISRIPKDLFVVAAAARYPFIECILVQLWPSQSQHSSKSKGNHKCASKYLVQCCPNTMSLISRPPPSLATSVQYKFQGEGMVDYSLKCTASDSSSTAAVRIVSILSKAFKDLNVKTRQMVSAKSNQFFQVAHQLFYCYIRVYWLMWVLTDIKCGKLWLNIVTIITIMCSASVGC